MYAKHQQPPTENAEEMRLQPLQADMMVPPPPAPRFSSSRSDQDSEEGPPSEVEAQLRGVSESGSGSHTSGLSESGSGGEEDSLDTGDDKKKTPAHAVRFVKGFMDALMATKPDLSETQKRKQSLKPEEKRERKKKVNRRSAQKKRIQERELIDTLSKRYSQLSSENEALKQDCVKLRELIGVVRGLKKTGTSNQNVAQAPAAAKAPVVCKAPQAPVVPSKNDVLQKLQEELIQVELARRALLNQIQAPVAAQVPPRPQNPVTVAQVAGVAQVPAVAQAPSVEAPPLLPQQQLNLLAANGIQPALAPQTAPHQPAVQVNLLAILSQLGGQQVPPPQQASPPNLPPIFQQQLQQQLQLHQKPAAQPSIVDLQMGSPMNQLRSSLNAKLPEEYRLDIGPPASKRPRTQVVEPQQQQRAPPNQQQQQQYYHKPHGGHHRHHNHRTL